MKRPIWKLNITGVGDGENEIPHIEMIEPDTDFNTILATEYPHIDLIEPETNIDPILAGAERLL